jgi:hypothetical protein
MQTLVLLVVFKMYKIIHLWFLRRFFPFARITLKKNSVFKVIKNQSGSESQSLLLPGHKKWLSGY